MTSVGDVIQTGQPIPDDVTAATDRDGASWAAGPTGWYCTKFWDAPPTSPAGSTTGDFVLSSWGPLTVTAVREQPAIEVVATSTVGGAKVPVYAVREQPGEPEPIPERQCGREDSHGGHLWKLGAEWRCEGFTGRAGVPAAAPELQQADASPVLDLVRKACLREFETGLRQGQGNIAESGRLRREADDLRARIAALVPQRPVQARDCLGELFWQHDFCGEVYSDRKNHERFCDPGGPWRPLLVGGAPAPESGILAHARTALHERDAARAEVERLTVELLEVVTERDEARAEIERLVAQPDPLVLSLPEVPEGTEALTGIESGRRYARGTDSSGETVWAAGIIGGTLGEVLDGEPDGVRVELALPREPRTWPKLDDAPDGVSKVEVRRPDGTQFVCARRRDGNWAATIAFADPESAEPNETFTWGELLGEGDVTEVTE